LVIFNRMKNGQLIFAKASTAIRFLKEKRPYEMLTDCYLASTHSMVFIWSRFQVGLHCSQYTENIFYLFLQHFIISTHVRIIYACPKMPCGRLRFHSARQSASLMPLGIQRRLTALGLTLAWRDTLWSGRLDALRSSYSEKHRRLIYSIFFRKRWVD